MEIKNEVLIRVYIVLLVVVLVAAMIFGKVLYVSIAEGEMWRAKGDSTWVQLRPVEAMRGNIFSTQGSLLATSLPFFEVRMDVNSSAMSDEEFSANVDSLAINLSKLAGSEYTAGGWSQLLKEKRQAGERYLLIKKDATITEVNQIKRFPLFRNGRYKGGLIIRQDNKRDFPFGSLANRTIGYIREGSNPIGLEASYDETLAGVKGKEWMLNVGNNTWMPVNDLKEVEPRNGDDIVTTIDVNLQDIAQEALRRSLNYHNADYGTAVVMEVKTGAVRAIANLGKVEGGYAEIYNYAIAGLSEPGSTFKAATMVALLEDNYVKLEDTVDLDMGRTKYLNTELVDAEPHNLRKTTVRHAFEISSNVGISKLAQRYYGEKDQAARFIQRLKDLNLNLPTGIDINGERNPYIKEAFSQTDGWSGITLPWMSIGYEVLVTPMQILTFYNAIANDGEEVKPYLVEELQRYGETLKRFKPTVLKRRIASKKTINNMKTLLEGVVENGTAKNLRTKSYKIAGKTGTAQINYRKLKTDDNVGYQSSFVGYFPADNPVYSCIVVVNNPRQNGYYGSTVAGTVFREISDKAHALKEELQPVIYANKLPKLAPLQMPGGDVGLKSDMRVLFDFLDLDYNNKTKSNTDWAITSASKDSFNLSIKKMTTDAVIPNVIGMRLRDALYVLENRGVKVDVNGVGRIIRQSLPPGTKSKGQYMVLTLE